jgi:putative Holliday junction resolvase
LGRILGLDVGDRRIGVAISDPLHIIASPLSVIDRKIDPNYVGAIQKIIDEREVEAVVVGLPLTMKGLESSQTEKVIKFNEELSQHINIPIHSIDERLSSVTAESSLIQQGIKTGHNKGDIDKTAAAIFLQEYLDSK